MVPRTLANRDVEEAIEHYLTEGATQAALDFVDSLERAYAHIARHPASGSTRYAHELDLPGMRSWPLGRFPHLVFYVEHTEHIDVWRVLHGHRDIPTWLSGDAGSSSKSETGSD